MLMTDLNAGKKIGRGGRNTNVVSKAVNHRNNFQARTGNFCWNRGAGG